ncbi:MAG TPA: hypothetical protein EYH02_03100 [Ignisphaera aggregans]|uniref:Uncharacterized protein n=1 Tax=Ignisphaera aggregans TaxID=334771 RepID=A0A833DUM0_9CREN|nr:hypothetical protein [Ignisphaera aggregans]
MAKPRIRLVVTGSNPIALIRCLSLAKKAMHFIKPYADVGIVIALDTDVRSGIMVEDEAFIECEDEEEALEKIIAISSDIAMNKWVVEQASAAIDYM